MASTEFTPRERKVVLELIKAGPGGLARQLLIQHVFDEIDGGPVTADNCLNILRTHINKKLAPHGLAIVSVPVNPDRLLWYQKKKARIYRQGEPKGASVRWQFVERR